MKTPNNIRREAELGRKIAIEFYNAGMHFRDGGREKVQQYKIGSSRNVDNALGELYREVNEYGNPMPIRVRKEQGVLKLEELLLGKP